MRTGKSCYSFNSVPLLGSRSSGDADEHTSCLQSDSHCPPPRPAYTIRKLTASPPWFAREV